MISIDNPRNASTSSQGIASNKVVVGPSAQIHLVIDNQATPQPYRHTVSLCVTYSVWRMAYPNLSSVPWCLMHAVYVRLAFDTQLQRRNDPLI